VTSARGHRGWLYESCGDYHRCLDPNWSYTPTYLRKMAAVRSYLGALPTGAKILDVGSGEGVLVEELRRGGWDAIGLDLNYEGDWVRRGDVRAIPFPSSSFDAVTCLDTLEHLEFVDQPKALAEVNRVLRPGGVLLLSVPNLAHLNSRLRLLLRGRLDRSDSEAEHPGERPLSEYRRLLEAGGFTVDAATGVTLTVPLLYRRLVCRHPASLRWLHDLFEPLASRLPSLSLLAILRCRSCTDVATRT